MTYELRVERIINAPPEVVFDAFVDQDAQREWYPVPPGWTVSVECDARVGGRWTSTWGPTGAEPYRETCVFDVLDRPRRIVMSSLATAPDVPGVVHTTQEISFEEVDGGTRMTVVQTGFPTAEIRDALRRGWPTVLEAIESHVRNARRSRVGGTT